jgi:hypothetical protein
MKLDITIFQGVAGGLPVEGEVCDLPNAKLGQELTHLNGGAGHNVPSALRCPGLRLKSFD